MIKLITPPGMLLTVALLVVYSAYAFLIGVIEDSWSMLAGGIGSIVAAYGTAMLRRWSRYLVYLLALGFIAKLGQSVYAGVVSGYFSFQFSSTADSLISLIPSAVMTALSCACCLYVFKYFRRTPEIGKDAGAAEGSRAPRSGQQPSGPT
jgi:hypothetical protein